MYSAETESDCFTDGSEETLERRSPEFLHTSAVDGEHSESGSKLPDVRECDARELTSPAKSVKASTEEG